MKNLLLFTFTFSVVLFATGCKDDKNDEFENSPLTGKWVLLELYSNVDVDSYTLESILKDFIEESYYDSNEFSKGSTIEYEKDGTLVMESYEGNIVKTSYRIDGDELVIYDSKDQHRFKFSLENDKLMLYSNALGEAMKYAAFLGYKDGIRKAELVEVFRKIP